MKHNKQHDNAKNEGPRLESVRFEFSHPTATTVRVAGTFNDWHADAKPMHSLGDGRWLKETVLPPGTYELAWWSTANGSPIRWPSKPCPIHSGGETRYSRWPTRRKRPISPTRRIYH